MAKAAKAKADDAQDVEAWMKKLDSRYKPGVELLRQVLKGSDKRIGERIKWNAPSYYFVDDLVTFGPRKDDKILLVFHHPSIVKIESGILEGEYKDRRLAWFASVAEIKKQKPELQRILKELVASVEDTN